MGLAGAISKRITVRLALGWRGHENGSWCDERPVEKKKKDFESRPRWPSRMNPSLGLEATGFVQSKRKQAMLYTACDGTSATPLPPRLTITRHSSPSCYIWLGMVSAPIQGSTFFPVATTKAVSCWRVLDRTPDFALGRSLGTAAVVIAAESRGASEAMSE